MNEKCSLLVEKKYWRVSTCASWAVHLFTRLYWRRATIQSIPHRPSLRLLHFYTPDSPLTSILDPRFLRCHATVSLRALITDPHSVARPVVLPYACYGSYRRVNLSERERRPGRSVLTCTPWDVVLCPPFRHPKMTIWKREKMSSTQRGGSNSVLTVHRFVVAHIHRLRRVASEQKDRGAQRGPTYRTAPRRDAVAQTGVRGWGVRRRGHRSGVRRRGRRRLGRVRCRRHATHVVPDIVPLAIRIAGHTTVSAAPRPPRTDLLEVVLQKARGAHEMGGTYPRCNRCARRTGVWSS